MDPLPTGTVSFLFTDIEGSTPLWESRPEAMRPAVQLHNRILHEAIASLGGQVFNIVGDAFLAAFTTAGGALDAAIAAQRALASAAWNDLGPLRVRMGVHTGEASLDEDGQYPASHTLNRAARIMSAGHGGQILLSAETAELVRPVLPAGVSLRDLGQHQLKGLTRPEHIYQALAPGLPDEFPPLLSRLSPGDLLPQRFTPFIGRDQEIVEINRLLDNPACRVLTLLGPGGIGKTRLALQVAEGKLIEFRHGACFVPLAGVASLEGILQSFARALQLTFHQSGGDHRQQLLAALQPRQLLAVLDNFEHLIGDDALQLLLDITAQAPGVKLLVTTRMGLNLGVEWQYPLGGMTLPEGGADPGDPSAVETFSAVRLFVDRARRIDPHFAIDRHNLLAVLQICRKVQGMPLGIELAAAWLDVLTPQEIAAELDRGSTFLDSEVHDLPLRQRGLRAVFDSTWALLAPPESEAFQALSVFRGGFTRQAAQAVAGASLREMAALVNKSLLSRDAQGRYEAHELLRQFAAEQLAADPAEQQAALDRLAGYFTGLLAEYTPRLQSQGQRAAFEELEADFDNIRLAWSWAAEHCQVDRLEQALLGLFLYCDVRFLPDELQNGIETAVRILETADSLDEREQRALAHLLAFRRHTYRGASSSQSVDWQCRALELRQALSPADQMGVWFTYLVGISPYNAHIADCLQHPEALRLLQENLVHLRRQGDDWGCALTLRQMGIRHEILGDPEQARQAYQEAASLYRSCGDQIHLAWCLIDLGGIAFRRHDYPQAEAWLRQAEQIFETLGEPANISNIQVEHGKYLEAMGEYAQALEYFHRSLDTSTTLGLRLVVPHILSAASYTALRLGDFEQARQLRQRSLAQAAENQDITGLIWGKWELGEIERLQGNLSTARQLYEESMLQYALNPHSILPVFYHRGLGDIALAEGDYAEARRRFSTSLELARQDYHTWSVAYALSGLGRAETGLGNYTAADQYFQEALQAAEETGARGLVLVPLTGLAGLHAARGEHERAVELATQVVEQPAAWWEYRNLANDILQRSLPHLDHGSG
jgi:predicted ATPase/class 3 adenylate cyclase/Tfp pilus assembly protein PilF